MKLRQVVWWYYGYCCMCGNHDVIFICPLSVCAIDCTEQTLPHCSLFDIASAHIDQAIDVIFV